MKSVLNHIFLPFLVFSGALTCQASQTNAGKLKDPMHLLMVIQKKGARATIEDLYKNYITWNLLLKKIASGDQQWLNVAVRLRPGTDAGSSEMLGLAVGEALAKFPGNVLSICVPYFEIDTVCSSLDVDDPRFGASYELAIAEIQKRIDAVSVISNPALEKAKKICLKNLKESIPDLKHFFEKN